jgi:hypothetical protein
VPPTETGRVELKFYEDPRIMAGVSGAVNHLAETAGMDEQGRAALVAAIEDACQESFHFFPNGGVPIEMSIAALDGRIAITLVVQHAPQHASRAEKMHHRLTERLDRVERDSRGDTLRFTLMKNFAPLRS